MHVFHNYIFCRFRVFSTCTSIRFRIGIRIRIRIKNWNTELQRYNSNFILPIPCIYILHYAGVPVVPFVFSGRGANAGILSDVVDDAAQVDLLSPPLLIGSIAHTTAFVSLWVVVIMYCSKCILLHIQISSNGLISFGSRFIDFAPQEFPISAQVVAPFWADYDLRPKGAVRYAVVTDSHPTLSCLLQLTSDLIRKEEGIKFEPSWLLVSQWNDVCHFPFCSMVSYACSIIMIILLFFLQFFQNQRFFCWH